jgi:hypothetical protein
MPPLSTPSSPRRKNTLFCPQCGHQSPTDGDWRVRASASRDVYTCPVCDAEVTTRPHDPGVADTPSSSAPTFRPLGRTIRVALAWQRWACTPACLAAGN